MDKVRHHLHMENDKKDTTITNIYIGCILWL